MTGRNGVRRRAGPASWLVASLVSLVSFACSIRTAAGVPLEPPPEAPDGADYVLERADSIEAGSVEVDLGAAGRGGERPRGTRRVRLRDGALDASVREGAGDPLAGGGIESTGRRTAWGVGRLAPRWGRGLVLGAAADPWGLAAEDRGAEASFRGRAGQGAWLRQGGARGWDLLGGRFAKRDLAGARVRARDASLGWLASRDGGRQASFALDRDAESLEAAMDGSGRWRGEAALVRPLGQAFVGLRARAGHDDFRSLAEPGRSGPAQAAVATFRWSASGRDRSTRADTVAEPVAARAGRATSAGPAGPRSGALRISALIATWRFRPGLDGQRAMLEVQRDLAHHGALVAGIEEQHGARRERLARPGGFRQGAWGEWRAGGPTQSLTLRQETWGARPFARGWVRTLTAARLESSGPAGSRIRVTHWVYRTRRGESLYLPESGSDRIALRVVSGVGTRSRLEMEAPVSGGRVRAGVSLAAPAGEAARTPRPQWTLTWTRRARTGTAGGAAARPP